MLTRSHDSVPTKNTTAEDIAPIGRVTQAISSPRPLLVGGSRWRLVVVMGVSGTGKSTLGPALAGALGCPFMDGDDLHPGVNVAKMARGEPLADADRWPWLEAVREAAVASVKDQVERGEWQPGVVVACSALKRAYRAVLRAGPWWTSFVYLKGDGDAMRARLEARQGHFMKAEMLASQLDALESPEGEAGVVTVPAEMRTDEQAQCVLEALSARAPLSGLS